MREKPVGVAVIGAGEMGSQHARNLAGDVHAQVVGIADPSLPIARSLAGDLGVPLVVADASELITDPRVDGVVIASPSETHAAYARQAIAIGKAVLCEKPLATTDTDAERVVEAELAGGRRLLQMGFMREFDSSHAALRKLVASGQLGRPIFFRGRHTLSDSEPAGQTESESRTLFLESVIHDLHSARFLTGSDIRQVQVQVIKGTGQATVLGVSVFLWLTNGAGGHVLVGSLGGPYEVHAEVLGQTGSADTERRGVDQDVPTRVSGFAQRSPWFHRFHEAYRLESAAWVAGLRAQTVAGPTAWDGYLALRAASACLESVRIGGPVPLASLATPPLYDDTQ